MAAAAAGAVASPAGLEEEEEEGDCTHLAAPGKGGRWCSRPEGEQRVLGAGVV